MVQTIEKEELDGGGAESIHELDWSILLKNDSLILISWRCIRRFSLVNMLKWSGNAGVVGGQLHCPDTPAFLLFILIGFPKWPRMQ